MESFEYVVKEYKRDFIGSSEILKDVGLGRMIRTVFLDDYSSNKKQGGFYAPTPQKRRTKFSMI